MLNDKFVVVVLDTLINGTIKCVKKETNIVSGMADIIYLSYLRGEFL